MLDRSLEGILPVISSDPITPNHSSIVRFGSSFIYLERVKLESSDFVFICRPYQVNYSPGMTNYLQMGMVM